MTVQFDTGSAIVYVLTDKCTENCNRETKFISQRSSKNSLDDDELNRIEYGYGSGYINGVRHEQKICFSESNKANCLNNIKIIEAD